MAPSSSYEARVDALYALPLDEFVAGRKRLGDELKREGAAAQARTFLALAKPTLSAWLTNQTVRRAPDLVRSLVAATDAVAAAQRTAPGARGHAEAFQAAVAEQRRLVAGLSAAARAATAELAPGGGATVIDRVENNLRWGAIAGPDRDAFIGGRLVRDVAAPGFGGFGDATGGDDAPAAARAQLTVVPAPSAATDARQEARADRERARAAAEAAAEAEREHRRLVAHHEAELRRLQAELTGARKDLSRVETERREADAHVTAAERALEAARQARDAVEDRRRAAADALVTVERDEAALRQSGPPAPPRPADGAPTTRLRLV